MQRSIVPISSENRRAAHRVLAEAFADDPVLRWLVADPKRDATVFHGLDLALHGASEGGDLLYDDGLATGAAVWDPPGHTPPLARTLRSLPFLANAVRSRLHRGALFVRAVTQHHPKEPHWYLATIGATTPGRGVGSDLLRHRLGQIQSPAYLESSNSHNISLYERFGFEVISQIPLPLGGPSLWGMWRP